MVIMGILRFSIYAQSQNRPQPASVLEILEKIQKHLTVNRRFYIAHLYPQRAMKLICNLPLPLKYQSNEHLDEQNGHLKCSMPSKQELYHSKLQQRIFTNQSHVCPFSVDYRKSLTFISSILSMASMMLVSGLRGTKGSRCTNCFFILQQT